MSAIAAPAKRAATTAKRILIDLGVSGKIWRKKVSIKGWELNVEAEELLLVGFCKRMDDRSQDSQRLRVR
jgi:hypothetical protein